MESNNSKIFIILGSFAVLGAGIYFYFKTKKTPTLTSPLGGLGTKNTGSSSTNTGGGSTNTGSSGANTSNTGSTGTNTNEVVLTTPESVIETAKKIAEAKDLATQIANLRIQKNGILAMNCSQFKGWYLKNYNVDTYDNNYNQIGNTYCDKDKQNEAFKFDAKIKPLDEKIGRLGYYESNGSIVKI
jgi:hypothetical protein